MPPMPAKKRRFSNKLNSVSNPVTEEIAQLKDLLDSEWALQQDYYEKKQAAAESDVRTQEKLTEEEELAYQKYLTDKQKLDAQAVQDSQKQWESLLQPIQRALDTSITGIILGTTTVQKALSNLAQSIIAEFVNSAVKSVFSELGKLLGASLAGGGGGSAGTGAAIRISSAASPAPAKTSWAAGSPKACSVPAVSSARSVSAAWFRVAGSSAVCSMGSDRCSGLNMAASCRRRRAVGWCRRPRWRCCTPMKWCCRRTSAKGSSR